MVYVLNRSVMLSENLKAVISLSFSLQDIQKDSCESNHNITCKVGYPFLKPAEEVKKSPCMQVLLAPCCCKGRTVHITSEVLFSCVHPKNSLCMFSKLFLMSTTQRQVANHQIFSTWAVRCGRWGCNKCILPSVMLSECRWHTSGPPGQKCLSGGFPHPGAHRFSYFVYKM